MTVRNSVAALALLGLCAGCASSAKRESSRVTAVPTRPTSTPATSTLPTTASPAPPSPAPAASMTSAPVTSGGPVPADGNSVSSVTFVSATQGWVLLTKSCSTGTCPTLKHTADGGKTWTAETTPPGGMTQVRFGSPTVGYAFNPTERGPGAPELDFTADGGTTWIPVAVPSSEPGNGVSELAISGGHVWAEAGVPYPAVDEAPLGTTTFTEIGGAGNRGALLRVQGSEAYVPGPAGAGPVAPNLEVATATSVGKPMTVPCKRSGLVSADIGDLTPLLTPSDLVLACTSSSTFGGSPTSTLFTSGDTGKTWTKLVFLPGCSVASLTRTSEAVIAACHNPGGGLISVVLANGVPTPLHTGNGFSYVGFTDSTHGVAITGTLNTGTGVLAAAHEELYLTADGGTTWTPTRV